MMNLLRTKSYINGKWVTGEHTFPVLNPFDQKEIAQVESVSVEQCKTAIQAASDAFQIWKKYTARKRSYILKNWYNLQIKHAGELAQILTLEQGKPLAEAKGEVKYGASFVEWFAEEARRIYGDVIPGHQKDKRITTIKQPIGVVAAITPWNFPNAMITRKVAPALAAGCTVIIKPSELTPLSALALAELADQAGFPPGVINIINTNNPAGIGTEMCSNPIVKKLSFTGSTLVGKLLLKQCADTVKKVSLELGGNAPFIVFDDADVDLAVEGAIASKFRNAGQTCICSNRIFVQESIHDVFVEKFKEKVLELQIGNGKDKGTQVGPLIEEKAVASIEELVKDAISKGGEVITGGVRKSSISPLVFEPTIITHAQKNMDLFHQEIFGPIAPIYSFKTEEEVIELANDTPYGLAAYFYGQHYARIWRVAEALDYGMVGINTNAISTPEAPFGGVKESGIGREGSKYGMDDFLELKYMCWGGI